VVGDEQTTIAARLNEEPVGLKAKTVHPVGVPVAGDENESETANEGGAPLVVLVLSPPPVATIPTGQETDAEVYPPAATLTVEPSTAVVGVDEHTTEAAKFKAVPVGLYAKVLQPVGVPLEGVGKESDMTNDGGVPVVSLVPSPPPVASMPEGHETDAPP